MYPFVLLSSDGVVLNLWFRSDLGTVALVPLVYGSGTLIPVPTDRYQGFGTRISEDYMYFSHFCTSLVPFR